MTTLRHRLMRLAHFIDDDFKKEGGLTSVEIGEDATGTIVLKGRTGAVCRATLAFPIGYNISFTGQAEGMIPGMDMRIVDQGRHPGGSPVLVLEIPNMPGIGRKEWDMAYFCSNVDLTTIY